MVLKHIIEHLEKRIAEGPGDLAGPLNLYLDIWRALYQTVTCLPEVESPSRDAVSAKIQRGESLCDFDALTIDWGIFGALFGELAAVMHKHELVSDTELRDLRELARDGPGLDSISRRWFDGKRARRLRGTYPSARSSTLALLTSYSVFPFLRRQAARLVAQVDLRAWHRGTCPVCGGEPSFASLSRESRARSLLCSRCATEWPFKRLACPFCRNENQNLLGFFPNPNPRYRIFVCDRCGRYLKTIDLGEVGAEPVCLVVESLLTSGLDEIRREGYR